jgi:hypothetical protein
MGDRAGTPVTPIHVQTSLLVTDAPLFFDAMFSYVRGT